MVFTELYLFKFPRPGVFTVGGDSFHNDLNSTELISLRHLDFFFPLELFKYYLCENSKNKVGEQTNEQRQQQQPKKKKTTTTDKPQRKINAV